MSNDSTTELIPSLVFSVSIADDLYGVAAAASSSYGGPRTRMLEFYIGFNDKNIHLKVSPAGRIDMVFLVVPHHISTIAYFPGSRFWGREDPKDVDTEWDELSTLRTEPDRLAV